MSAQPLGHSGPVKPEDRRRCKRYECELKSSCKPIEYPRSATAWPAQVRDISAGGVRLTLCRRFEPGTLLALDVQDTEGVKRLFLVRVVRVARRVLGRWALGCALNAVIDERDLEGLVETPLTVWMSDRSAGPRVIDPIVEVPRDVTIFEQPQELSRPGLEVEPSQAAIPGDAIPGPFDEQGVETLIEATIKAWIEEASAEADIDYFEGFRLLTEADLLDAEPAPADIDYFEGFRLLTEADLLDSEPADIDYFEGFRLLTEADLLEAEPAPDIIPLPHASGSKWTSAHADITPLGLEAEPFLSWIHAAAELLEAESSGREGIIPFAPLRTPGESLLPDITPLGLEAEPYQSWIRETPEQIADKPQQGGREAA